MLILKKRTVAVCIRRQTESGLEVLLERTAPSEALRFPQAAIWEGETEAETLNRLVTARLGIPWGWFFIMEVASTPSYLVWVHPAKLPATTPTRDNLPQLVWWPLLQCRKGQVVAAVRRLFKEKPQWRQQPVPQVKHANIAQGGEEQVQQSWLQLVIRKGGPQRDAKVLVLYEPPNWRLPRQALPPGQPPRNADIQKLLQRHHVSAQNIIAVRSLTPIVHYVPHTPQQVAKIMLYPVRVLIHDPQPLLELNVAFRPWSDVWRGVDPYMHVIEAEHTERCLVIIFPPEQSPPDTGRILLHSRSDWGHVLSLPSGPGSVQEVMQKRLGQPPDSTSGPPYGYSVAQESLPPVVFEGISPADHLPTRYTLYPQHVWVDCHFCDLSIPAQRQWTIPLYQLAWREQDGPARPQRDLDQRVAALPLPMIVNAQHYQVRQEISPVTLAVLESLHYTRRRLLLEGYQTQPRMEYLAHQTLGQAPQGCRILKLAAIERIMECGPHSLQLRVPTPTYRYQRVARGFSLAFVTPREKQAIGVYAHKHCTLYGLLTGSAQLWYKPMNQQSPQAWQMHTLEAESWIEIEGFYCHLLYFTSAWGQALRVQSVLGEQTPVLRTCQDCPLNTQCQKPPVLRHIEWQALGGALL